MGIQGRLRHTLMVLKGVRPCRPSSWPRNTPMVPASPLLARPGAWWREGLAGAWRGPGPDRPAGSLARLLPGAHSLVGETHSQCRPIDWSGSGVTVAARPAPVAAAHPWPACPWHVSPAGGVAVGKAQPWRVARPAQEAPAAEEGSEGRSTRSTSHAAAALTSVGQWARLFRNLRGGRP